MNTIKAIFFYLFLLQPLIQESIVIQINASEIMENDDSQSSEIPKIDTTTDSNPRYNNNKPRRSLLGGIRWDPDALALTGRENPTYQVNWNIQEQRIETFVLTEFLGTPTLLSFEDLETLAGIFKETYNELVSCIAIPGQTRSRSMAIDFVQFLPTEFDGFGDSPGVGGNVENVLPLTSPSPFTYLAKVNFVCKGCFPDSVTLFKKRARRVYGRDIEGWNECIPHHRTFLSSLSQTLFTYSIKANFPIDDVYDVTEVKPREDEEECLVEDNFESDLLLAVEGLEQSVTETELLILEQAAVESYNELNALNPSVCDESSHIAMEAVATIIVSEDSIGKPVLIENAPDEFSGRDWYRRRQPDDAHEDITTTKTTYNNNNNNDFSIDREQTDRYSASNKDDYNENTAGRYADDHSNRSLKTFTVNGESRQFRVIDDLQEFRDMAARRKLQQEQEQQGHDDGRRLDNSWWFIWMIVYGSCNGCPLEDCLLNDVQNNSDCDRRRRRSLLQSINDPEMAMTKKLHQKVRIKQLQKNRQSKMVAFYEYLPIDDNDDTNDSLLLFQKNNDMLLSFPSDDEELHDDRNLQQEQNYQKTGCLCAEETALIENKLPRTDDYASLLSDTIALLLQGEQTSFRSITNVVYVTEVNHQMNEITPPDTCCGYPSNLNDKVIQDEFQKAIDSYRTDPLGEASIRYGYPINCWDVSDVVDFSFAFAQYRTFNEAVGCWDTSNGITMSGMFARNSEFNQNINNWVVSKVENMSLMFIEAKKFNQPLGQWDVSSLKDGSFMFAGTTEFNQNLVDWPVIALETAESMFEGAIMFNQDLCNWAVTNSGSSLDSGPLTNTKNMFFGTNCEFQQIDPDPTFGPFCYNCVGDNA